MTTSFNLSRIFSVLAPKLQAQTAKDTPMTTLSLTRPNPRAHSVAVPARAFFALWKQRRDLARLDDHMLEDLGLTRHQVKAEATRPLWDVPKSWRE